MLGKCWACLSEVFRAESMRTLTASNKQMGQRWGLQFDKDQIRRLLRESSPRSEFYKLIREELKRSGRWRNRSRGKPNRRNLAPVVLYGNNEISCGNSYSSLWHITAWADSNTKLAGDYNYDICSTSTNCPVA